ncbi:MAG: lysophospholipase [Rhodobacteraceae bacterium]|nr:lysophospholipase [Paracoccaceae bacterium]
MHGRFIRWVGAALLILAALAWLLLPEAEVEMETGFDAGAIGTDTAAYLAEREAGVSDLRDGAQKRIVWAAAPGEQTPLSIIYVHGFSASAEELRPVPDRVAADLSANLFFARLAGHGRDGAAMAEPTLGDWMTDMAEAMEIGRRIGDQVILIGTSAGGALAALTAINPAMSQDLAGVVLVSPSFKLRAPGAALLTLPGARTFLPWAVGESRGFTPVNEAHGRAWTTEYPTEALLPLGALVRAANGADYSKATVPALFILSDADTVVDPTATRNIAARWGGPRQIVPVAMGPQDDPGHHVIAGDILSPGQTENVTRRISAWAREL